jgi:hypothetical protein
MFLCVGYQARVQCGCGLGSVHCIDLIRVEAGKQFAGAGADIEDDASAL